MRTLLAVVTGLIVILGVVSTNLWHELRNERTLLADLRLQLTQERASRLVAASRPVVAAPAALAPTVVAAAAPAAPPACRPTAPVANSVPVEALRITQNQPIAISERDLLKDPEYRKARLAQRRLDMQRNNPGVAEALGLSEKDADKFLDLLAENQIRMNELQPVDAGNPQATAAEYARQRQALLKQQEESVAALLGASGFSQWQEYQQNGGARSQAMSLGSQLMQMGLPLSNAQLKPMTAALIADQQRQRQVPQPALRVPAGADEQTRAAVQEEAQRRSAESNRRMLAAIAPSLTPQQLAVFREQFEMQETMNRISSRARDRAIAARATDQ